MSEFKVVSCTKVGEFTGQYGKSFKYLLMLEGQENGVELTQKPETPVPGQGDTISGEIEQTQYGLKFKKTPKPFGGSNFGGGNKVENAEKQGSIERQNALTNAVNYCTTKATVLAGMGKEKEALAELTGKHIISVAQYFKKFNQGSVAEMVSEVFETEE